jgi:hypothetical protein
MKVLARLAVTASLVLAAVASTAPLAFEANRGQLDAEVRFVARGADYVAFLTSSAAVVTLGRRAALRVEPARANPAPHVIADAALRVEVHRVRGHAFESRKSAPMYRRVRYLDVYPGIDLVYHGEARALEYDFVVAPGADPDRIALRIDGAERSSHTRPRATSVSRGPSPTSGSAASAGRWPPTTWSTANARFGSASAATIGRDGSSSTRSSRTRRISAAPATRPA